MTSGHGVPPSAPPYSPVVGRVSLRAPQVAAVGTLVLLILFTRPWAVVLWAVIFGGMWASALCSKRRRAG